MINSIAGGSFQDYRSQASYQGEVVAQSPSPPAVSAPAQAASSQPIQDTIQLSAFGVSALETPEELFKAAAAGNNEAIAIIREDLTPIPHTLDLTA
jgi:hypothetical protein